jgi:hypothetical protein
MMPVELGNIEFSTVYDNLRKFRNLDFGIKL